MVEPLRAGEKDGRRGPKGFGNPADIQDADVALSALHASYICAVQMSHFRQFLLGVTERLPPRPDTLAECEPWVHERPIVEVRAVPRLQTISSFTMSMSGVFDPNWIMGQRGHRNPSCPGEEKRSMETYRVVWEIDIDADSPEEAAETARQYQIATDTTATVFDVRNEAGGRTRVDLLRGGV